MREFNFIKRLMGKPAGQVYFGQSKAACLCSYCCSHHLWFYDRGRLGRVETAALQVDTRAKEGKGEGGGEKKHTCPISLFFWETLYAGVTWVIF